MIVAVLGAALTTLPIHALRVVVGALLLLFGLQWLRKAILRAAGRKAMHDERMPPTTRSWRRRARLAAPRARGTPTRSRSPSKGVLLEGFEVALIVVTFGAGNHRTGLAAAAAGVRAVGRWWRASPCARRSRGYLRTR